MDKKLENLPDILTASEFGEHIRLDEKTVIELAEDGVIPGIRLGPHWRFRKSDLITFIYGDKATSASLSGSEQKIGDFVKQKMRYLFESGLISEDEIENLTSLPYSKQEFGISFPFLKRLPDNFKEGDNLSEHTNDKSGYPRYWRSPFAGKYLVSSQWYDRHREKFVNWLAKIETHSN